MSISFVVVLPPSLQTSLLVDQPQSPVHSLAHGMSAQVLGAVWVGKTVSLTVGCGSVVVIVDVVFDVVGLRILMDILHQKTLFNPQKASFQKIEPSNRFRASSVVMQSSGLCGAREGSLLLGSIMMKIDYVYERF